MAMPRTVLAVSMLGLLLLSFSGAAFVSASPIIVTPGQVLAENLVLCTPTEGVTEQGTIVASGTAQSWISIASSQPWSDGPDTVTNCDTIPYSITVPSSASGTYELVWTIETCTFMTASGGSGTCSPLPSIFLTLDFQVSQAPGVPQFPVWGISGVLAVGLVGLLLLRRNVQRPARIR